MKTVRFFWIVIDYDWSNTGTARIAGRIFASSADAGFVLSAGGAPALRKEGS